MRSQKPIRRSQLIAPFGVGALVDFRNDESLMTASIDYWPYANEQCPHDWHVEENRLQRRLKVTHFRTPPDFRMRGPGVEYPEECIPFVQFPRWHYCPKCGAMEEVFHGRMRCPGRPESYCNSLPETKRPWLIPSRFVAICPKGHIEDFPFMKWVHREGNIKKSSDHLLWYEQSYSSASLSGIGIRCSCGKKENMGRAFNFNSNSGGELHQINYDCSGQTPWLGNSSPNYCGEYLRVVQRGASNVYFPFTISSIYLPLWGEKSSRAVNNLLENLRIWEGLTSGLDEGKYIQKPRCEAIAISYRVDPDELCKAAQQKLDGGSSVADSDSSSEEEFRRQEYEALRMGRGGESTRLMIDKQKMGDYGQWLCEYLEKVCLVKKLRETRVLVGFSRLLPAEDRFSRFFVPVSENQDLDWLPATVVHGEGIFFEFNFQRLDHWTKKDNVRKRSASLAENFNSRRRDRGLSEIPVNAKYLLLHTFAHVLIRQLSFECGYGSAALRERIYCNSHYSDQPMQGVLIYTASGDSEGTLGGLVRQGKPEYLSTIVQRAIHQARWCSSDPVCIESFGQGSDNANFAACHSCVLLPETSCESGNRLLDRGLLVSTANEPNIGFFNLVSSP